MIIYGILLFSLVTTILGQTTDPTKCFILQGTNAHRAQKGRPPLSGDKRLDAAAKIQCSYMAALGILEHITYGTKPSDRVASTGYKWKGVAENIYDEHGYPDSNSVDRALKGWIHSPGHEANMVGDYSNMGSAHCTSRGGEIFWAQVFGKGDVSPNYMYQCAGNDQNVPPAPVAPLPPPPPPLPPLPLPLPLPSIPVKPPNLVLPGTAKAFPIVPAPGPHPKHCKRPKIHPMSPKGYVPNYVPAHKKSKRSLHQKSKRSNLKERSNGFKHVGPQTPKKHSTKKKQKLKRKV